MNIDYTLYLCTNTKLMSTNTIEECVEEAILGGVSIVQVREKNINTLKFLKISKAVKKITSKYNVPLIINDRIGIALAINADGVHLGQNDISCAIARKILGKKKIIGISVNNLEQAIKAKKQGANYIGVGAMFRSKTKPDAKIVSIDELKKIKSNVDLPIVLIGGINKNTIPFFSDYDIAGYAMITPIISQNDIRKSAKELLKIIQLNKK